MVIASIGVAAPWERKHDGPDGEKFFFFFFKKRTFPEDGAIVIPGRIKLGTWNNYLSSFLLPFVGSFSVKGACH